MQVHNASFSADLSGDQLGFDCTTQVRDADFDTDFDTGESVVFDCTMQMRDASFGTAFDSGDTSFQSDFDNLQIVTSGSDYNALVHKPSINGVILVGDQTTESLNIDPLPSGGQDGDILMRVGDSGAQWTTPANDAEQDNTRPITSAAVYMEIGNINALLATI